MTFCWWTLVGILGLHTLLLASQITWSKQLSPASCSARYKSPSSKINGTSQSGVIKSGAIKVTTQMVSTFNNSQETPPCDYDGLCKKTITGSPSFWWKERRMQSERREAELAETRRKTEAPDSLQDTHTRKQSFSAPLTSHQLAIINKMKGGRNNQPITCLNSWPTSSLDEGFNQQLGNLACYTAIHNNLLKTAKGYLHNVFEDIVLLVWGLLLFLTWKSYQACFSGLCLTRLLILHDQLFMAALMCSWLL